MDDANAPRFEIDPQSIRKVVRATSILVGLVVLICAILATVTPYTNYLWFVHDVRQPQVFLKGYSTKGSLFLCAFLATWAFVYLNLKQAFGRSLIYIDRPDSVGRALISHTMRWVQDRGQRVLKIAAPVAAFFLSMGFSNEWSTYLLWRNQQPFQKADPMFGLDASFYVFTLPWYSAVLNYLVVVLVITTALSIGLYIGLQSLALMGRIELGRPKFRIHVSLMIAISLVAIALLIWLKTYELPLSEGSQFTGAGYVESQLVWIQRGLAVFLGIIAILTVVRANQGKPYGVPLGGGIAFMALWGLLMWVYPSVIQRLVVDPNLLSKQGPYAARAIEMTRFAYSLDKIDVREMDVQPRPTEAAVSQSGATLDNMRLWDPDILRTALENLQAIRPYYNFEDVDVDRYTVNGKQTIMMLSARDINLAGLDAATSNWTNLRLRYTHGYGVVMANVDRATSDGWPNYLVDNIPLRTTDIPVSRPQIYFSDWRDPMNQPTSEYALVNTGEKELDYESTSGGAITTKWSGDRGIPIDGMLARLAFSIVLGDGNLLVTPNIRSGARLLMRRGVLERANAVYPFLKFDSDPYLVILDGRLIWMLDGYSTTNQMPYSRSFYGVNYIRNTVKATVDAYTGEINAYALEPDEPLLKANRSIYPGLVKDIDALPAGLREHFRYPEDMLEMQSIQLQTYHVGDPTTFLSNSDAWNIASERDINGARAPIRPYYVQMQLPDEPQAGFVQMLPFTPNKRPNMSGWLAAHCDPADYGRLVLYRFVSDNPSLGPEQMESKFNSWPEISDINRQYNNDQSEVIPGNLLVMPIGKSVMYVEPLFLQSNTPGIQAAPRLSWVVLALRDQVVVGESYQDALKKLFQAGPSTAPVPKSTTVPTSANDEAKAALDLLRQAETAQRNGDWAKYGSLQKLLKAKLEALAGASP